MSISYALVNTPPRLVDGSLRVHSKIKNVREELDVSLRLHESTHVCERREQRTALQRHARNDRVVRSLSLKKKCKRIFEEVCQRSKVSIKIKQSLPPPLDSDVL